MGWQLNKRILIGVAVAVVTASYLWGNAPRQTERTFIILKPDGYRLDVKDSVYRRLEDEIGLTMTNEALIPRATSETLTQHYAEHVGRAFFNDLVDFMQSGPIIISIWEGRSGTVQAVRKLIGPTDPAKGSNDTIRGQFGTSVRHNVIHASDSVESALREISIWFR